MCVTPALRKPRQENHCRFQASMGYTARLCLSKSKKNEINRYTEDF